MKLLNQYNDSIQSIHDYFGYKEGWVVIPIDDRREYYWCWIPNDDESPLRSSGRVTYSSNKQNLLNYLMYESFGGEGSILTDDSYDSDDIYEDAIYTQRHLPKFVFFGEEYTMISVDTNTDGNKFLAIFSNNKGFSGSELDSFA